MKNFYLLFSNAQCMVSGPSRPECIVGHVFDSANDENYVYMAYKRANIEFGSPVKLIVIMT